MTQGNVTKRTKLSLDEIVARTTQYLAAARAEPARYPIEVRAIAKHIGCGRSSFYLPDPRMETLLAAIDEAKSAAKVQRAQAAPLLTSEDDAATAGRSLDDLGEEIEHKLGNVTAWMAQFISSRKHSTGTHEAPLHMADLQRILRQCSRAYHELVPLVEAWQRERAAATGTTPEAIGQTHPPEQLLFDALPRDLLDEDGGLSQPRC